MSSETLVSLNVLKSRLTHEQQMDLAVALNLCLECGGSLVKSHEGELCCSKCGLIWAVENTDETIPIPDGVAETRDFESHWQPGNTLAFLKGLGDPALQNSKGLMRVLAKSRNGTTDLGLRVRHIQALIQWEDPPQLRCVLSRVSSLLKQLGFDKNWVVANACGNLARAIVNFKLACKFKVNRNLADAVVMYTLRKHGLTVNQNSNSFKKPHEEDLTLLALLDKFKLKPKALNVILTRALACC